jgi:hypothetical protein
MLVICSSCTRHIRPTESACPFCGGAERREGPRPASRATRAAMLFGGAAAVVAGVACGDTAKVTDGGADRDGDVPVAPAYGAPALDATFDAPIAVDAAYGGPPFDGGRD